MKKNWIVFTIAACVLFALTIHLSGRAQGNTYYLSPTGDDSNSGTSTAQPWATFERAWQDLYPGDTLILMDGVYYQQLHPSKRDGEPGNPITIRAQNDGQAIIDGEYERIPVKIGEAWPGPIGEYYVIEGIIARNSVDSVYEIVGDHNVLRRVSGYNAHTDENTHVFDVSADHNLIEDCVAAGTGRKMILIYNSESNTVRRCFTYWQQWDGREDCAIWPWGENINIYNADKNIVENSIGYGPVPYRSISIIANAPHVSASDNKILGSVAIGAAMNEDGTPKVWPDQRPGPTTCTKMRDFDWPGQRSGFQLFGSGIMNNNEFRDVLAWGNAALGFTERTENANNTILDHATIYNNGLDNRDGPWPGQHGGIGADTLQDELDKMTVTNSYIENVFVDWPDYPNGSQNFETINGEGARLEHRYVDGVLTDEPLWPWPMEERVQAELGISVEALVLPLTSLSPDFAISVTPAAAAIAAGETAAFTVQITPQNGFDESVQITVGNPQPSTLQVVEDSASPATLPATFEINLTDQHDPAFDEPVLYVVPVTVTSSEITREAEITLLVNGSQAFLPLLYNGP